MVPDASSQLLQLFNYPLDETLTSENAIPVIIYKLNLLIYLRFQFLEDGLKLIFEDVLRAYEDGSLLNAITKDEFKVKF